MKHSTKGALLSGLFFPGTGQIALKRYKRGIALMAAVFACVSYIVMKAVEQAFSIINKLDVNSGVDMNAITHAATEATQHSDSLLVNIVMFLMIACWVFGIVDAYAIGKQMDNGADSTA